MRSPKEMQALYRQGENISAARRREYGLDQNSREIVELSYDLQTGSYINAVVNGGLAAHKAAYSAELARRIQELCGAADPPASVLEVGVGEATTFVGVVENMPSTTRFYGFDLSWSRAAFAKDWLEQNGAAQCWIGTGDLFNIPFRDRSIDIVYTSHSIEPNGGQEEPILRELLRVARRYVVLLEPAYELATQAMRKRMDSHGYCRGLPKIASELGGEVLCHESFPHSANPENPTAITIIAKQPMPQDEERRHDETEVLACPKYKTPLREIDGLFFSEEALVVYPTIGGIPCLRIENGILASKFAERPRNRSIAHT